MNSVIWKVIKMIWTECQNNQNHSGALVHPSSQGWLFNGSIKQKEQVIMRLSSMCFSKLTLKYRLFQHFPSPRKSHLDRYWPKTQAAYKGEWRVGTLGEAGIPFIRQWLSWKATTVWSQAPFHTSHQGHQWPWEIQKGKKQALARRPISQWEQWKVGAHLSVTNKTK